MPKFGHIAIAVVTATLACAGGAAAIGNVTGVSPMVLIRPTSATSMQVLTVANVNSSRVPDIASAVAHPQSDRSEPSPSASEPVVLPTPTTTTSAAPSASASVQPRPGSSSAASPSPSPSMSVGGGSDDDHDDDDRSGKIEPDDAVEDD